MGVRQAGVMQTVTTALKLVPLLALAVFGLFFVHGGNFTPFNASGGSAYGAVTAVAALTLWSFLGVESATIPAGDVRDPRRTIPRATVVGTLVTALVYVLSTGRTVVLYFAKPSTRTRISSETAVAHPGGTPLTVGPDELPLGRAETIEDTARVLSSYAEAIVVRTYADEDVHRLAAAATVPVVDALTDGHHPLQRITDLFTLVQVFGDVRGRRLAYVGYEPDPDVVALAGKLAAESGSTVQVGHDPVAAVRNASAVYTDVWLSMGDAPDTRAARLAALAPYRVTADLMARARPDAVFLHCLPAHRGEEITAEVIDGPRAQVFRQAANRRPVAQAVLRALLTDRLTGREARP
jgi:ornithine carbamoyltransferase